MKEKISCSLSTTILFQIEKEAERFGVNRSQMIALLCNYSLSSCKTLGYSIYMRDNSNLIK